MSLLGSLFAMPTQDRKIVGVPPRMMAQVADVLATHRKSPDWQSEMVEVPLDIDSGRYVLVLSINDG